MKFLNYTQTNKKYYINLEESYNKIFLYTNIELYLSLIYR